MAEMAAEYHNNVQYADKPDLYAKIMATSLVLDQYEAHLNEQQHNLIDNSLDTTDLTVALKLSKTGSSPGIDGLPYEFYKWL
ncbi:hypothetical protein B0H14DRAFT_2219174, partial [Mycena olivaceomarginata]